ncbi:unnamed protein product [Lupinus luteus]|uniref:RING-type E3 ubiquitin transferase n=1 Tax=Lupinus luteus TaxID=3873 RepID=A0AAV1YBF8_LUPLU
MQGQRKTTGSFQSIVNLMQGPSSSGTDMNNQQSSLSHVQNSVDFRLSDYRGSSGETACLRVTSPNVPRFSGWNAGESSSRLNLVNQVNDGSLKSEHVMSSSCSAAAEDFLRSEERQFEPDNVTFPASSNTSLLGNQSRIRPSFLQGSSSNHITQNVSLDMEHNANTADRGKAKEAGSNVNNSHPSGLEREQTSFGNAPFDHMGTSSESSGYVAWGDSASSSSSVVNWGSSCKRKSLEGNSRQLCIGGSSNSFVQSEGGCWSTDPADLNCSSSLCVSAPLQDIPVISPSLPQTTRNEVRQEASNPFPLISFPENVERPLRNFDRRITQVHHQESVLNLSSPGSARHLSHSSPHRLPGPHTFNDSLELRLTAGVNAANSGAPQNQSPDVDVRPFTWNRASSSRGPRSSIYNSGERAVRENFNLRVFARDSTEHPMNVSASSGHEPTGWHTSSGNVNNSGGIPPPSWIGSGSNVQSLPNPSWIVNHEAPTENLQRLSEFNPWSLFPSLNTTSGVHNGHSTPSPSGPLSFTQGSSSNQSYPRTALLTERRGSVLPAPHSLRGLTVDNEGRHRLLSEIRQVLVAMRRGENLRAEDYMLFDPFIYHGMAEMHDRHRGMRLDVDNMSYEELLALEERIGDVNTGLCEDVIINLMKQRIYMSFMTESSTDLEPCCICQEEYADGENIGSLDCGHEFHINCIKQWLMQKNLCPICKTTALAT